MINPDMKTISYKPINEQISRPLYDEIRHNTSSGLSSVMMYVRDQLWCDILLQPVVGRTEFWDFDD